ncbi:tetratricopeptide repeat protein [Paenibacillus borealis]|uniref:Tetratricopeptide repeat protein n=1 Tax=Paenibacillus borealis TaxID=160799 RepID=A0A089L5W2_PAEBO|nr:hypothetical protein [Paenibacillus borealis]AIQ56182.1 hypothetical protein PBOR_03840 [Paenibacillus borealis]
MTFDEELYLLEEECEGLPQRLTRERIIQFLKDKIQTLSGTDLQLAYENLARFYLDQGTDIKENFMNAHEARMYFQKVLDSEVSQSLRDAATYHLGHAALLERNPREALKWFERALSSECIDRGRKVKAYYHAARCSVHMQEYDKAREYLDSGRALDTTHKYQTEYEDTYYVIQIPRVERQLKPYRLCIPGENPRELTNHEVVELEDSSYVILDIRSELHPKAFYREGSLVLTEGFAHMLISLSCKENHSDDYWLMNHFEKLQLQSLKVIVARQNQRFQKAEIPVKIARKQGKYVYEGPDLGVLTILE